MAIPCNTVLPAVSADFCAPNVNFGQIEKIYFTRVGDDFTLVTDPAEWATRLSNSDPLPASPALAPVRELFVIGSLGEPEQTPIVISAEREVYPDGQFEIPFLVDDTSQTNYDFAQTLIGQNGAVYAFWFEAGGLLFGDNAGVVATMRLFYEVPEASTDLQRIRGTIRWKGGLPDRNPSPFV